MGRRVATGVILGRKDGKGGYDGKDGKDGCAAGCGGAGGFQAGLQNAETNQLAIGIAASKQNAVNGNAPVSTAGGNISSGPELGEPERDVERNGQRLEQRHTTRSSGSRRTSAARLPRGYGGGGGFQLGLQKIAKTNQGALGLAFSNQNADQHEHAPVDGRREHLRRPELGFADGDVDRNTDVSNRAKTRQQDQWLEQE